LGDDKSCVACFEHDGAMKFLVGEELNKKRNYSTKKQGEADRILLLQ
jgi:hypothetical protein